LWNGTQFHRVCLPFLRKNSHIYLLNFKTPLACTAYLIFIGWQPQPSDAGYQRNPFLHDNTPSLPVANFIPIIAGTYIQINIVILLGAFEILLFSPPQTPPPLPAMGRDRQEGILRKVFQRYYKKKRTP
jgi:hypothetical protein